MSIQSHSRRTSFPLPVFTEEPPHPARMQMQEQEEKKARNEMRKPRSGDVISAYGQEWIVVRPGGKDHTYIVGKKGDKLPAGLYLVKYVPPDMEE